LKSIALAPHQVRALDSLGVLFASHRSVLIGALAIQCQVPMPRLTADVDVIMLASDASIAGSLGAAGWAPDRSMVHRWRLQGAVVDIIQVTDDDLLAGVVNLNGAELSVVGFDLAFSEGNAIRVTPATEVLVPPLPVLVLLKMIAWMDRPFDRAKDLGDIAHIWDHALSDDERWAEPNPWLDGSNAARSNTQPSQRPQSGEGCARFREGRSGACPVRSSSAFTTPSTIGSSWSSPTTDIAA
jgi:predicted nucleotidyltransferase